MKPLEVMTDESLEIIESNADRLMTEVGLEIHDDYAIGVFRDAGATVDGTRVRFDPGMCRSIVQATAPAQYTQHARNPQNTVEIGGIQGKDR